MKKSDIKQIITQQLNKILRLNQVKSREQIRKQKLYIHRNINPDNQDFSYLLWDKDLSYQDLKKYCQRQQVKKDIEKNKKDYIFKSIEKNHIELFNTLLEQFNTDINIQNKDGWNPLHWACQKDNIQIVKILLNHPNIDVNELSKNLTTPLYLSLDKNIQIFKLLLKHPKIDVNKKSSFFNMGNTLQTPLEKIILNQDLLKLELILKHPKINVNIGDVHNWTPLHSGSYRHNIQIVKLLLKHPKIDVNVKTKGDNTPLHQACYENYIQIVKLLLKHPKIDVNIKNKDDKYPINVTNNKKIKDLIKNHPSYKG